jgi:uncharacterized protein
MTSRFSTDTGCTQDLPLFVTSFSGYKLRVKNILVTGGTGFVGQKLVSTLLNAGRTVTVFGRDLRRIQALPGKPRAVQWNYMDPGPWTQELAQQDVVVHLVGEPAVGRRLTESLKRQIRDSRVKSTRRLVDAIGQSPVRPKVLICASAVGFYGSRPTEQSLDESAPAGEDFLAQVCHEWESAASKADLFGVRVVMARLGVVIGAGGGIVSKLLPLFRLGLGGRIASGRQPMAWVSLDDAAAALAFCVDREGLRGPVNVVSPNCVTNEQFTSALANALQRIAILPVPALALKIALGRGADSILGGQRVTPAALEREGFEFRYPDLRLALAAALARS